MPSLPTPAHRLIRSFASARQNRWSHSHLYNAVTTINQLHAWLAERGTTLTDATPDNLNDYLAHRRRLGRSSATLVADHTKLKGFYTWAAEDPGDGMPYIAPNPMLRVAAPKQDEDPDPAAVPEAEEWHYRALLATCFGRRTRDGRQRAFDRRDAAMIAMLWHCGMRRGELVKITVADVNFDTQMVHLARTKGRSKTRSREVYIADEAMELLNRLLFERGEHDGPLFESSRRRPGSRQRAALTSDAVRLILERRAEIANRTQRLPATLKAPAHSFRRGMAVAWLDAGGQQVTLETHMGWRHDGRMAARYTRKKATELAATEAREIAEARTARKLRSIS